jgi:hypothetical protein
MPKRLVRLLNTGFGSQGFEFVYETEFAAARDEDAFCVQREWINLLLLFWWPRIQTQIEICKPRDCWWVPMGIRDDQFRKVELPADVEAAAAEAREAS